MPASARIFTFGFSDDRVFDLAGTDGGLLERPVPVTRLRLSPGERAEIVVRMQPAERVTLRGYPTDGTWCAGHAASGFIRARALTRALREQRYEVQNSPYDEFNGR